MPVRFGGTVSRQGQDSHARDHRRPRARAHASDASGGPADTLEGVNGQEEEQGRGHADAP